MKNKTERLIKIKELLISSKFSKQEELLEILVNYGFKITQATLSRDLKELGVGTKYDKEFGFIYQIYDDNETTILHNPTRLNSGITLEVSGNMAVLKTLAGFANGVAAVIDSKCIDTIAGTIAGNDTVLIIIRADISKERFLDSLIKEFTNIINIYKP